MVAVRRAGFAVGCLLAVFCGSSSAAAAAPERVARDAGGGDFRGISAFELHRGGLIWWKGGASSSEVGRREGTLAAKPSLGLLPSAFQIAGPATRYLGRGYDFRIDGAARDDLHVYYAANGYLRRKPLGAPAEAALSDPYRVLQEEFRPPFGIDRVPVSANGAVLLRGGDLWYSHAEGGRFFIRRPGGLSAFGTFSAAGQAVQRLEVTEVRNEDGTRLKEVLLALTRDGLLYRFDFDPALNNPVLLARNAWDFGVRQESTLVRSGGLIGFRRVHTTAIYVAVGDLGQSRLSGRLLRVSARDGSSGVEYDTGSRDLQVRGVAVDESRIFASVTPLRCGALGCLYDEPNAQVVSRFAPAHSDLVFGQGYGTIADRTTTGGALEGLNLRTDGRWVYWISGDSIWRLPADAQPIERDFEAFGVEVVQTTQDLGNTTRLAAEKPTVVRAYARVVKDSLGSNRHPLNAGLQVYLDGVPQSPGLLQPVNTPVITPSSDLSNLRTNLQASYLFELPAEWVRRGRLRAEFIVNPGMGIPETGQNPLGNNSVTSPEIEVVRVGSPCLVFVPIHTGAPDYDPLAPGSGFAEILERARSLMPVSSFRYAIKGDRISKPVPKIKFKTVLGVPVPYPALDMESFVTEDGFSGALFWLRVYSTFEQNPRGCDDTHYVGTVHWTANTSRGGATALGLATRPDSGIAEDLIVKMEPPGSVMNNPAWREPRGGETLAHELSHNYGLRHVDQTASPLNCGGGKPDGAGAYGCDTCTIGIINSANLAAELQSPNTQFGFDPLTWNPIAPDVAADLMAYRNSKWLSRHTLDQLLARIPGYQGASAASRHDLVAVPEQVILVTGTLDLSDGSVVLWPAYRLPSSAFDRRKVVASLSTPPRHHGWNLRLLDDRGGTLLRLPLHWERQDDGNRSETGFVQFIPDQADVASVQILEGDRLAAERRVSLNVPLLGKPVVQVDEPAAMLRADWRMEDPDLDPVTCVIQYTPDDGGTWQTLQAGYPDQGYATRLRLLPGGARCRIRVTATDGFHAVSADSDAFTVPRHAPVVNLGGVLDGETIPFGANRAVVAAAYDAEDGSLPGAAIQWRVDGPVARSGTGTSVALFDLPPGGYAVHVAATDSEGQTDEAMLRFEVQPLTVPETEEPLLDGDCGDAAYAQATVVRLDLGGGRSARGRLVHSQNALRACVTDLAFGTEAAPARVGIWLRQPGSPDPASGPRSGFFTDEAGTPSAWLGEAPLEPTEGFAVAVGRGEQSWSAELRIADGLLGGWGRPSAVLLTHSAAGLGAPERSWPAGGVAVRMETWAAGALGTVPSPVDRPPVARVGAPRTLAVRAGQIVRLDGTASHDPDGAPLSFAWSQVDGPGVKLRDADTGSAWFEVGSLGGKETFRFSLLVSDGQLLGEPVDAMVTLVPVEAGPEAAAPGVSGGSETEAGFTVALYWPGQPGDRCLVQASVDLVRWETVGEVDVDYRGLVVFTDTSPATLTHRFYRATSAPPVTLSRDRQAGALRFRGQGDYVRVAHAPELQPYPFTLAFWVRSTDTGSVPRGLVSKYADGSLDGYSLFLSEGRIRGWYFARPGRGIWDGALGLDSGFVANGTWQHVALVVDDRGGRLFLNGSLRSSLAWSGAAGAPSNTVPLQFGRYADYLAWLAGDLDDIALWNRALPPEELLGLLDQPPDPADPSLVGYWSLDDGSGEVAMDGAGAPQDGMLIQGPSWVESEVPYAR